jgi:hypothetical protein
MSVPRIPRADGAGVRILVADCAVIVALRAVGIGCDVRCHIGSAVRRVTLNAVVSRIRARAKVLRLGGGGGQRQDCSRKDLLHSLPSPLVVNHHAWKGRAWRRIPGGRLIHGRADFCGVGQRRGLARALAPDQLGGFEG